MRFADLVAAGATKGTVTESVAAVFCEPLLTVVGVFLMICRPLDARSSMLVAPVCHMVDGLAVR